MNKEKLIHGFIITTFVSLYLIVSIISTIHVIEFFSLSNPSWLAISLAIAFEIGAAASLASLIVLDKMNKSLVWGLFIVLTCMQMMGNTYYAFTHLTDYQSWVELFGLVDEDPLYQKRILSIISGAILPLVALGFIKSLVDYIRPAIKDEVNIHESITPTKSVVKVEEPKQTIVEEKEIVNEIKSEPAVVTIEESLPPIEDILEIEKTEEAGLIATQAEAVNYIKENNPSISDEPLDFPMLEEPAENEESSEIDNTGEGEKKSLN